MLKIIITIILSCIALFFIIAIYSCFIISGKCSEQERYIEQNRNKHNTLH